MSTPFTPTNGGNQIVTPGSGGDSFSTSSDQSRTLPRQISTGNYRGTQTITGALIVADPGTNNPVITISGVNQNQLWSNPATKVNYMLAGSFGNGSTDYGVKVAFPGIDVTTATDDQLIFNSSQNVFKIINTGVISSVNYNITDPGSGTFTNFGSSSIPLPLNLSFVPGIIAFIGSSINFSTGVPWTSTQTGSGGAGGLWRTVSLAVIGGSLIAEDQTLATGTGVAGTVTGVPINYYLLQESAENLSS